MVDFSVFNPIIFYLTVMLPKQLSYWIVWFYLCVLIICKAYTSIFAIYQALHQKLDLMNTVNVVCLLMTFLLEIAIMSWIQKMYNKKISEVGTVKKDNKSK